MSLEIRPITLDEVEQAEFITAYSFNNPDRRDLTQAVERSRRFYPPEWSLASFEDGEMTAFIRMIPFAHRINGRGLSFAGVGPVVTLPQHRRKGHAGALLRRGLEVMRDRGQVLSGLHTPHPSLYRRYGWEIASVRKTYSFAPKDVVLRAQPGERGRLRMLAPDDWAQLDRVYRQHSAQRNGPIHRGEVWWREAIFAPNQPAPADVALWEDGRGEPQGYVVYHQRTSAEQDMPAFWVREVTALTTDAYLNLLAYLLRHDLPKAITWGAPIDDPFLSLVEDTTKVRAEIEYDVMLRVCDVEGALRQRQPADRERALSLALGVSDASAPWNDGTWQIDVADGDVAVERTDAAPQLSLSAAVLAPVFNGFLSPSAAAFAGLAAAKDEQAVATADAVFAVTHPPYCADGF
jgi:predicted acetyltransferase